MPEEKEDASRQKLLSPSKEGDISQHNSFTEGLNEEGKRLREQYDIDQLKSLQLRQKHKKRISHWVFWLGVVIIVILGVSIILMFYFLFAPKNWQWNSTSDSCGIISIFTIRGFFILVTIGLLFIIDKFFGKSP